jgi:hypothetical protein
MGLHDREQRLLHPLHLGAHLGRQIALHLGEQIGT